jgi:hypothetical protein
MNQEHTDAVVALSIKNQTDPNKNTWMAFAKRVITQKFGCDEKTLKWDIDNLISQWSFDKWKTLVDSNPYLDATETEAWINSH